MLAKNTFNVVSILIVSYFIIVLMELIAQFATYRPVIFLAKISAPILLVYLYHKSSVKQNPFFYVLISMLLFANILFFFRNPNYFFLASAISIIQKMIMLLLVISMTTERRFARILLSAMPFLLMFYFLNSITNENDGIEFNTIFFESVLVSFLGGISLAAYLKNDNRQHSWLLISTLLFTGLQFVVFIEKYYSFVVSLSVFSLIAVMLSGFGFFTFYKFLKSAEKRENYYL